MMLVGYRKCCLGETYLSEWATEGVLLHCKPTISPVATSKGLPVFSLSFAIHLFLPLFHTDISYWSHLRPSLACIRHKRDSRLCQMGIGGGPSAPRGASRAILSLSLVAAAPVHVPPLPPRHSLNTIVRLWLFIE